jgi:hypothetical protein
VIRFTCPHCDAALKVPDDRTGQPIKCPKCKRPTTVPENLDDEPPVAELDEGPSRKVPAWGWAVIGVGVLLLLGVGGVQLVQSVRRPAQSATSGSASSADDLTTDQGRTRWLVGEWEQTDGNERLEYRFESGGQYRVKFRAPNHPDGCFSGTWYFEGGKLQVTIRDTSEGRRK